MKVAYIVNRLIPTGPINVVLNIIKGLDNSIITPVIIELLPEYNQKKIVQLDNLNNVETYSLNSSYVKLEFFTSSASELLLDLLERLQVDIAHAHGYHPNLLLSRFNNKTSIKTLSTLHSIARPDFVNSKGLILGRYMYLRFLRSINNIDQLVAISDTVNNYYSSLINRNITTIYNSIDTHRFSYTTGIEKSQLREKLGLDSKEYIFIVIGNLTKLKSVDLIAKTFINLKKEGLGPSKLIFLGEGPLKRKIKKYNCREIQCLGFKENVYEYIKASDALISASKSEGFGLNLIEAISCGKIAIHSDIPVYLEFEKLLEGLSMYRFDLKNEKKLECLMNCVISKKEEGDLKLIKKVEDLFSIKTISNKYACIYSNLIKEKTNGE